MSNSCLTLRNQDDLVVRYEEKNEPYLAYLNRVAEQSCQAGIFLMSGEIVLQTAQWDILHDQLESLTACLDGCRRKHSQNDKFINRQCASLRYQAHLLLGRCPCIGRCFRGRAPSGCLSHVRGWCSAPPGSRALGTSLPPSHPSYLLEGRNGTAPPFQSVPV